MGKKKIKGVENKNITFNDLLNHHANIWRIFYFVKLSYSSYNYLSNLEELGMNQFDKKYLRVTRFNHFRMLVIDISKIIGYSNSQKFSLKNFYLFISAYNKNNPKYNVTPSLSIYRSHIKFIKKSFCSIIEIIKLRDKLFAHYDANRSLEMNLVIPESNSYINWDILLDTLELLIIENAEWLQEESKRQSLPWNTIINAFEGSFAKDIHRVEILEKLVTKQTTSQTPQ